ncbi:MAG: response regulator transcription factor [Solirubrobacterales bacterium]
MPGVVEDPSRAAPPDNRRPIGLTRRIRILVVDEHPVVQQGVRLFLEGVDRVRAVDVASSGEEAIAAARAHRQDVALLDPWLPDMLLADVVRRLAAVSPYTRVVIFTAQLSPSLREDIVALRVHGVLGKDASPERLLEAITLVVAGKPLVDDGNHEMLLRAARKVNGAPLTRREHEVLLRVARGESNAEIAAALFLAPTTVKSYLQSALRKLGARNRAEAVFKLSELRLL